MRTIQEIKQEMIKAYTGEETVRARYGIDKDHNPESVFSKISIENILFYSFALCVWVLEGLFYQHKADTEDTLLRLKPHSLRWYRNKALEYLHGVCLVPESDYYDLSLLSPQEIEKAKIVKYCAVSENALDSKLYIKIATENGEERGPLDTTQLRAFKAYLAMVKDAGVFIEVVNRPPDSLKLCMSVHYNPLLLDEKGNRIDGNGEGVVETATRHYAENLPFNGELTLSALTDALQKVEGVVIPQISSAESRYGTREYAPINDKVKPDSGYFTVESITITYSAYDGSDV